MLARPAPDLCAQIRRARGHFKLKLVQMAAELRVRPEWLSKILNGHQPASYNLGLRFEDFLRRRGLGGDAFACDHAVPVLPATARGTEALRKRIEEEYRLLLASVGDDPELLEAVAVRMASLRLPRRKRAESSRAALTAETRKLAPHTRRKTAGGGTASIEAGASSGGSSPIVPREFERRDFIAQRYETLARKGSKSALASAAAGRSLSS